MPLTIGEPKQPSRQSLLALDYLNFFLADVRTGVGPFMATYLMASLHWNPADIGVAMAIMGIATLVAETPCGALADSVKEKRLLIVIASTLVALSCIGITILPNYFINTSQVIIGVCAAVFPLAVTAITLGIVGQQKFAIRIGRNEMFNHAGNVAAAVFAGALAHFMGREWIFYIVRDFCCGHHCFDGVD